MKLKIITAALLSALIVNASSAEPAAVVGHVGTKYTSDYDRRGELLSAEAIQAQVGFNVGVGGLDVFGDFHTNQATDADVDTNELTVGVGSGFFEDKLNAYIGVYNTESTGGASDLEAFAIVQLDTLLDPAFAVYRDTDDSFYTFEGQVSHTFDLQVVDLKVGGVYGNTETSAAADSTYTGARASLSKSFDNLNVFTDVAVTDSDLRSNQTIWGVGLNLKF